MTDEMSLKSAHFILQAQRQWSKFSLHYYPSHISLKCCRDIINQGSLSLHFCSLFGLMQNTLEASQLTLRWTMQIFLLLFVCKRERQPSFPSCTRLVSIETNAVCIVWGWIRGGVNHALFLQTRFSFYFISAVHSIRQLKNWTWLSHKNESQIMKNQKSKDKTLRSACLIDGQLFY